MSSVKNFLRALFALIILMSFAEFAQGQCHMKVRVQSICNDNGTPCDASDDYHEVSGYIFESRGTSVYTVIINGMRYGPFKNTHQLEFFDNFPANGQPLCVEFLSDDKQCKITKCTPPLLPCPAEIKITLLEYECNDNGTANDPTDDYYTVKLITQMLRGDPAYPYGYDVDVAGQQFGTFKYGRIVTFTLPADGMVHQLVVNDENDPVCMDMKELGPLEPCSIPCFLIASILSIECFDNDSPDPSDDFYKVVFTASASVHGLTGKYKVEADFTPPLQLVYNKTFTTFFPANKKYVTILFTDVDYEDCNMEIEIGPLDPCSKECKVDVDSLEYICFDNGTPDPSDDYYELKINVIGEDAGSGYNIRTIHGTTGPYNYNVNVTLTFPADGSTLNLIISDVEHPDFCKTYDLIGPLDPCSEPCQLSVEEFKLTCFDNGTNDLTDDYYEIDVSVLRPDANGNDVYEVIINGVVYGPFAYGSSTKITLPADGSTFDVIIHDVVLGDMCESTRKIGPLEPCSSICDLTVLLENIECDNNGTGHDPSDDTYSFDLTVNGVNVGASWIADDASMTTGNYGNKVRFGPFPISGGDLRMVVQDVTDQFCRYIIDIEAPEACSDSCFLDQFDVIVGKCDDNGTGADSLDDFFFVDLFVNGVNSGLSSSYKVSWNGSTWGPFSYGSYNNIGPLSSDGSIVTLVIQDSDLSYCELLIDVTNPPCSECNESADAGPSKILTCSVFDIDLEGSSSAAGVFTWYGPKSTVYNGAFPKVTLPGWYRLEVIFENGCIGIDSVEIKSDTLLPVAVATVPEVLTCNVKSVEIDGNASSSGTDIIYKWTDQTGSVIGSSKTTTVTMPGQYCLEVIDTAQDCTSGLKCVNVEQNLSAPNAVIFIDPDNILNCKVDSVRLIAGSSVGSIFHWEFRNQIFYTDSMWLKDTGMVYLIATDTITGCSTLIRVRIRSLVEYPIVNLLDPDPLTCNIQQITIDGSSSQQGTNILFQWFDEFLNAIPGENGMYLKVNMPGTYYMEATDTVNGCSNIDTVEVTLDQLFHPVDAGPDGLLRCDDHSALLTGSTTSSLSEIIIEWTGLDGGTIISDGTTLTPTIDGIGRYEIVLTDRKTGCITRDTVNVEEAESPVIDALASMSEVCLGYEDGWIDIESILKGTPPYKYYVNGQEYNDRLIQNLAPGTYNIEIVDASGCRVDTSLVINEGVTFEADIAGITFLKEGDTTTLTATTTIPVSDILSIIWEIENGSVICGNCSSINVSPDTTTTYQITVVDKNGCEAISLITIEVRDRNLIWAPNVFSPNGDKVNDIFKIFGKNLVLIEQLLIFDRWGELIYTGEDLDVSDGWEGRLNGKDLNPAVFVYYAIGVFKNGDKKELYGDVTLIR